MCTGREVCGQGVGFTQAPGLRMVRQQRMPQQHCAALRGACLVRVPTKQSEAGSRRRWRQGSASERSGSTHTLPMTSVFEDAGPAKEVMCDTLQSQMNVVATHMIRQPSISRLTAPRAAVRGKEAMSPRYSMAVTMTVRTHEQQPKPPAQTRGASPPCDVEKTLKPRNPCVKRHAITERTTTPSEEPSRRRMRSQLMAAAAWQRRCQRYMTNTSAQLLGPRIT